MTQLRKEIEQVKADAKKAEDEMSETFMGELKGTEAKLKAKSDEAEKL